MSHRETTLRHLWLAGLGLMARVRRKVESISANSQQAPPTPFVTTEKVAKRAVRKVSSSGSRKAGETESHRRIAGRGR
jgi:hypothetical protein